MQTSALNDSLDSHTSNSLSNYQERENQIIESQRSFDDRVVPDSLLLYRFPNENRHNMRMWNFPMNLDSHRQLARSGLLLDPDIDDSSEESL